MKTQINTLLQRALMQVYRRNGGVRLQTAKDAAVEAIYLKIAVYKTRSKEETMYT